MATHRYLSRAPVTEAVVDLRLRLDVDFDVNSLRSLEGEIGYKAPKDIKLFEMGLHTIQGEPPQALHVDRGLVGLRFESSDGRQIAQLRKDGFTFSRLAPYTNWEKVFAEASRIYKLYAISAKPDEATRPAVRFINRMELPSADVGDFSPFLTAPPQFIKDQNVFLTGFLTQVQIAEPDSTICATVIQTIQTDKADDSIVPVILDLDVFDPQTFDPDPEVVLSRFAALRETKNRYFFSSITDKAADLFT